MRPSLNDDIGIFHQQVIYLILDITEQMVGTLDSVLSHVHVCDGYSYEYESFGSTDGTTGEWKTNPSQM